LSAIIEKNLKTGHGDRNQTRFTTNRSARGFSAGYEPGDWFAIAEVSQEAFADLIEMHRAYYSAIERGERNLTVGILHRVAKGLGARMADLMRDCNI
jgi:transcriptional regulator with XRE-family HTH domain